MAGMGIPGRDLVLERQQQVLESGTLSETDRAARVDLQKRILEATVSEKGWEDIPAGSSHGRHSVVSKPPDVRSVADDGESQAAGSDPAGRSRHAGQPYHADRLAELGRARKKSGSTEVKHLPGLDHFFVAAKPGESPAGPVLQDKAISAEVAERDRGVGGQRPTLRARPEITCVISGRRGARPGKARGARIPGVCKRRATQPERDASAGQNGAVISGTGP